MHSEFVPSEQRRGFRRSRAFGQVGLNWTYWPLDMACNLALGL